MKCLWTCNGNWKRGTVWATVRCEGGAQSCYSKIHFHTSNLLFYEITSRSFCKLLGNCGRGTLKTSENKLNLQEFELQCIQVGRVLWRRKCKTRPHPIESSGIRRSGWSRSSKVAGTRRQSPSLGHSPSINVRRAPSEPEHKLGAPHWVRNLASKRLCIIQ